MKILKEINIADFFNKKLIIYSDYIETGDGRGMLVPIPGKPDSACLIHNIIHYNTSYNKNPTLNPTDYPYSIIIGGKVLNSRSLSGFRGVEILSIPVLVNPTSPKGTLFRRIYKIERELIFLGPVKKTIEECLEPSPNINVHDYDYLRLIGWEELKREQTPEEKLKKKVIEV